MTGQQSDTRSSVDVPVTEKVRGKTVRLVDRSSRAGARLKRVEVLQEDIDNAMRENSHSCMIAEAIKRQYPSFEKVQVDIATIRWTDPVKQRRVMCLTPMLCQSKLSAFDFGTKPSPFSFELRSAQVTALKITAAKIGEDGEPVKRRDVSAKRLADGTVKEYVTERTVRKTVSEASMTKEFVSNGGTARPFVGQIVGGKLPPQHRASRHRKFGQRAFTWADGEAPEEIAKRQQRSYGWTDEQMAAEGWQFAKDRLAAKSWDEQA